MGGGLRYFYFHPEILGFMIQFDKRAYFSKMGWWKITNYSYIRERAFPGCRGMDPSKKHQAPYTPDTGIQTPILLGPSTSWRISEIDSWEYICKNTWPLRACVCVDWYPYFGRIVTHHIYICTYIYILVGLHSRLDILWYCWPRQMPVRAIPIWRSEIRISLSQLEVGSKLKSSIIT